MKKNWIYSYGELVGKSHAPRQIPCQDKALVRHENDVYVAVVSDGCGSSDISQYGSLVTTEAICNLFTSRFDELYEADILSTRKLIVNEITEELKKFIASNHEVFAEYKIAKKEKYEQFIEKRSEEEFDLDCLNATALFVAEKNGLYMLGAIGDGIIGAVIDNKLKIVMEEKKDGEVNGTIYPANIYNLAKNDERWYATSQFQLKKPRNANIQGFILMSDGVDGLIDQRVAFQKKFASGAGKLIKNTVKAPSFEEAQKALNEELLPRLVEFSKARDDCSVALLIHDDCEVDDHGYVVTYYEKPTTKDEDDDEVFEDNFFIDNLDIEEEKTPEQVKEEASKEKEFEKETHVLYAEMKKYLREDEAGELFKKINLYFFSQSKARVAELLEFYVTVLSALNEEESYLLERNEKNYKCLSYMYQFDDKLRKLPGNKITRRDVNETEEKVTIV